MNPLFLFLIFVLLVGFPALVLGHELTHVALNDFRVDGFCFLDCDSMQTTGILGNHYTPVAAYLTEPIKPIAKNETIAFGGSVMFFTIVLFIGGIVIRGGK